MRVQLKGQALRLRIDEAELARLLAGETLDNATRWPDGRTSHQQAVLAAEHGWQRVESGWCISLADAPVKELAKRLPSREGLEMALPVTNDLSLEVLFDIDTRDSARRRLRDKHATAGNPP